MTVVVWLLLLAAVMAAVYLATNEDARAILRTLLRLVVRKVCWSPTSFGVTVAASIALLIAAGTLTR